MPGQLKARRPRRGGRGRRRRSGARNKTNHQAEDGPPPAADDPAAEQEPRESFPARIEPERAPAVAAREREGAPPGDGGALDDVPPLTSPSLPGERRAPRRPSARRRSPAADRGGRRGGARTGIRSVPAPLGEAALEEAEVESPAAREPGGRDGEEPAERPLGVEAAAADGDRAVERQPGGASSSPAEQEQAGRHQGARSRARRVASRRRGAAKRVPRRKQPAAAPAPAASRGETREESPAEAPKARPRGASRAKARRRESPKPTLVIDRTGEETRVAVLEHGTVTEVFIERESERTVVGNIYKGRVSKVLPGMQSAFVSIGLERDAFLYVSDISLGYDAYEGLLDLDEVEGGDQIRKAVPKGGRGVKIEKLLKEGQELLVQVTKEPIGTKGARITSYVTLPGRYLVLMPQVDHVGVSRKIGEARERARLRRVLGKVRPEGMGFIVRTVAEGCEAEALQADARALLASWDEIRRRADREKAPAEIQPELKLVPKIMRDMLTQDIAKVVIDDEETYRDAMEVVERLQPEMAHNIVLSKNGVPIFEKYGVQAELDRSLKSRVWLKSGGSIVINQTEALVAIDVNTGKYVGKHNLEETVLKTNLEAAAEIVRQLRLRDLGGIIVVDFIDMEERKSKRKLIETFEKELERDRARTKVLQISDFGLVELTRQRTKKSLERLLCTTCPYCTGSGKVKSTTTIVLEIQRELQKIAPSLGGGRLIIRANPEVAQHLESDREALISRIASLGRVAVSIHPDSTLHHEQFEIENR